MVKVKASKLILDYNLYPRHQINPQNVRDLRRALQTGVTLPPVIADKKSQRVIDGFHRVTEALKDDRKIDIEYKTYKNDSAMLLDAIRLNAGHGQKLTEYDKARCVAIAGEAGISRGELAAAMAVTTERVDQIRRDKIAIAPSGRPLPIKHALRKLAGKHLTVEQARANERVTGTSQVFMVNQVIDLLEGNLIDHENKNLMERIGALYDLLSSLVTSETEAA